MRSTNCEKKRFRATDHQQIRDLIHEVLIPELELRAAGAEPGNSYQTARLPTPMAWRHTLLLEFDSLFRRYAPRNQAIWNDTPLPSETGTQSLFIKFFCAVLDPLVEHDAADPDSINTQWRAIRNISKGI